MTGFVEFQKFPLCRRNRHITEDRNWKMLATSMNSLMLRTYLVTKPVLNIVTSFVQATTIDNHTCYCSARSGALDSHITTTYGVARNSILNSWQHLNVINGPPPDAIHDVLEGVLPLEVKLMLGAAYQ